ncbi:hemerythrin domain-containing protein [Kribbella antibiotica]|nr:hemerythrin domain-containing protein [Kribbella antibiotica]
MLINPDAPADKPETQQMKVIHRAMRREFAQLPELIAVVPAGDTARARLLGDHLALMLGMLHEHHEAEDELLWPLLVERVPLQQALINLMEQQHEAVAQAIGVIEAELPRWTADANLASRDSLTGSLRDLEAALVEHLDLEETEVLPLIHDHLTVLEWEAPKRHAMKNGPKSLTSKLTMAGIVLEDATPREQAWFLNEMPPPARLLWRAFGARRYQAYKQSVRAEALVQ